MNAVFTRMFRDRRFHIFIGVVVLLLAWFIYYTFFVFHITRFAPADNIMPTSYSAMRFEFNKSLKAKALQKADVISIYPNKNKWAYEIKDNILTINFASTFNENDTFTVSINNIKSNSGDVISFKKLYTVKYVDLNKLPSDDVKYLIKKSDSFETSYPLIKKLPIETDEYSIIYRYPDTNGNQKMPIIISSSFNLTTNNPDGIPSQNDMNDYLQGLRDSRKSAISRLKTLGFNKTKYTLYFNEPYLTEEFGGYYIGNTSN